jgi:aerobic-type carbon monoxide dehydrogenase small subunit (CoxS/CutS family)
MFELKVNGQIHAVNAEPLARLSDVLRAELGLIGVRVSCAEGECGSCTVLVDGQPVTSCLMLARQAQGAEIITIEGIGTSDSLDVIQQAFIDEQAFQCAFCTPGFIVSAKAFLDENPNPTEAETAIAMSGNICRCGAYPYIVKAVMTAAQRINRRNRGGKKEARV